MTDDLTLAGLLCARLCHDLAGPAGAAAAGVELLEDGMTDPETLALVAASARGVTARLKVLRVAFGPAGREQPAAALAELVSGYFASLAAAGAAAVDLDWRPADGLLSGERVRLVLNLILLARDALAKGGGVSVESGGDGVTVAASGVGAQLPDEAAAVLLDGQLPAGPRGAQALLAVRLAEALSTRLRVTVTEGGILFQA